MSQDLVTWARVITIVSGVAFMILFPAVMRLRMQVNKLPTRTWWFVVAVELAWLENIITGVTRIVKHIPWQWHISPIVLLASIIGLVVVLGAGEPPPDPD